MAMQASSMQLSQRGPCMAGSALLRSLHSSPDKVSDGGLMADLKQQLQAMQAAHSLQALALSFEEAAAAWHREQSAASSQQALELWLQCLQASAHSAAQLLERQALLGPPPAAGAMDASRVRQVKQKCLPSVKLEFSLELKTEGLNQEKKKKESKEALFC